MLDFAALWRSRVTAISSEPSKELWKEESLIKHEATPDSATTQFSFRKDSKQTFGELPTEVKNTISHRAKAIRALADRLRRLEFGD